MNKEQITSIYNIINERDKHLNGFYNMVNIDIELPYELYDFMAHVQLEDNSENRLACITRFIGLRNDGLIIAWKKINKTAEEIENLKKIAFAKTSIFHIVENNKVLSKIKELDIPNFYKIIFEANLDIGCIMTDVHLEWENHILNFNNNLIKEKGSISNAIKFLKNNNLMETYNGEYTDRSYSGIVLEDDKFKMKTFKDIFPSVKGLVSKINVYISKLNDEIKNTDVNDEDYEEQKNWIIYLKQLSKAFNTSNVKESFQEWIDLDVKWMKLKGPIQMVHPIEFYDDKLRNAVSIEFDIRVKDPETISNGTGKEVANIFNSYIDTKNNINLDNLKNIVNSNIDLVQLHIGKQLFYSGSQFDGLASAQVIPNDEEVSMKYGKKIFAFSDKNLELALAKPKMKISEIIFGKEIEDKIDDLKHNRKDDFNKIYDITTIGHEYGHILWKDEDTEITMNDSGNFKNIEEFKASSGGIVSFINSKHYEQYKEDILINTLKRAVGLINWKKVSEVEAYYCEGLITLDILFNSNVLNFKDEKLIIDLSENTLNMFYNRYSNVYYELVESYLKKESCDLFLFKYVEKDNEDDFVPKNKDANDFLKYYYDLYLKIGNELL